MRFFNLLVISSTTNLKIDFLALLDAFLTQIILFAFEIGPGSAKNARVNLI